MKKIAFKILLFFMSSCLLFSQLTTDEEPVSFTYKGKVDFNKIKVLNMSVPDLKKVAEEDELFALTPLPLRLAYPMNVHLSINNAGV